MIKNSIKQCILRCVQELHQLELSDSDIVIEIPKNRELGDFSTNIAFRLAKPLKQSPLIIAEALCTHINSDSDRYSCSSVKGFINIHLLDDYLWQYLSELLQTKPEFSKLSESILLEYVSANPTGPLHVGHGRWAVLGAALSRLFVFTQQRFKTETYINDAGNQISLFYESVNAVKEGKVIPENGYHGHYIHDLASSEADPVKAIIQQQRQTLDRLGVSFDTWYSEKSLHESSKIDDVLSFLKTSSLSYESDDALWFKSSSFGDDKDRVLIKSDHSYTYFLVDLAYHFDKVNRGFDYIINIWGADHHGYVPRVQAGIQSFTSEKKDVQFKVLIGQLVSLFRNGEAVRMSKRTGEMITLDEVIDEIGVDATSYFLLHKSSDSTIDFDLELAKQKNAENPVFYVQYAHARMCTLLSKFDDVKPFDGKVSFTPEERALATLCLLFYDVVWDATSSLSPYKLTQYCVQLAKAFHVFYEHCPIKSSDDETQRKRLCLVTFTKDILKNALNLCGISAPQRM
ncbi:arginine--tRNA ligase [Candidatus Marinamargulisbacteria bacterium SCGC AG-343-D04]|nr:arginine--tRNA ligase [Candidatus Marinamargulisbacteria bacterium SCGC AG-343-D04]